MRAYVLRRAPASVTEDVVSETFLVAWRRLDGIGGDPLPWLLGVARRLLANQHGAERRRGALATRLAGLGRDTATWEPPAGMDGRLADALAALSPREREALLLVAWEELEPSPTARFFVLRDQAALTGNDITHPTPSRDAGGAPAVQFQFTAAGAARFQAVTARVARRGAHVSVGGMRYNQHFAVALNNQLLTVPQIDFQQYPDGIEQKGATAGADITGALTPASAQSIAGQVRRGTEPLTLRVTG